MGIAIAFVAVAFLSEAIATTPSARYVRPPRFDALVDGDGGAARHFFKEYGFVVYKAADAKELEKAWDLFWEYFESLGTGVSRHDPATWTADRWPTMQFQTGIMPYFGIGQSAFMWHLRSLARVRAGFALLWGTEQLLASLDGVVIYRPKYVQASEQHWWHVDQNPRSLPGFDCIQGLLQLTTTSPEVGGFVVVPGSHALYPSFYEDRYGELLDMVSPEVQYFSIPSWDPHAHSHFAESALQLHLEAGDLVVWNSTTLHCSTVGVDFADGVGHWSSAHLGRVAALLTMSPREKASEEVLKSRREAVCQGTTTTHWPHRFIDAKLHNEDNWAALGDAYTGRFKTAPPPTLSAIQLGLLGYSDEELAGLGLRSMDDKAGCIDGVLTAMKQTTRRSHQQTPPRFSSLIS